MRLSRTRSLLVSASVLALAVLGWFYLAPTQIGGSTRYVVTHGISMEPLLHAGDLALVRPESSYRVGQVVAYHSTLLHTIVLHRIIRIDGSHYVFKGDNNDFIDPTHPTRALLIGSMWLYIPNGGVVLSWLHDPWVAAVLFAAVAIFLLFGGKQKRRRRRDRGRRGNASRTGSGLPVSHPSSKRGRVSSRDLLTISVVGIVVFAVLSVVAFVRPSSNTMTTNHPYSQTVRFGYHARVRPGPVYPNGIVATGDPVYVQLVHRVALTAAYRLTTTAPSRLHGTIRIRGTLTNTSGWSRSFWLGPPTRFVGNHGRAGAVVNLTRLESLSNRISAQIGSGGSYTLAVVPHVKVAGQIAGQPIATTYSPALSLSLGTPQFLSGSSAITQQPSSSPPGSAQQGLNQSRTATITSSSTAAATLAGIPVSTVRWISLAGLAVFIVLALVAGSRELESDPDPAERINSRYKHLIVPVAPVIPSPDHPPIDVSSIDALAQLAEKSERLILHDRQEDVDNYLIDDQGTLFRFSAPRAPTAHLNGSALSGAGVASDRSGDTEDHSGSGGLSHPGPSDPGPSPSDPGPNPSDPGPNPSEPGPDPSDAGPSDAGPGDAGPGDPGPRDRGPGHPSHGPSRPGPGRTDPGAGDPAAANQAAAILSSAAATLSAAAASAATSNVEETDAAAEPRRVARGATGDALTQPPGGGGNPPEPESINTASDVRPVTVATRVRTRPLSLREGGGDPGRPPKATMAHWSRRPQYRLGLTIGPLALTFLAWRRLRTRRRRRGDDAAEERRARGSWTTRNLERR